MSNSAIRSWFSAFVFIACLLTGSAAWAQGVEDDYLRIYALIDDADALDAKGSTEQALTKYAEAHKQLLALKKANPTWNTKTVAYRINYVAEKLAPKAVAVKPDTAGAAVPQPASKSATPAAGGAQVKLINAGSEPRTVLRLHPTAGDKQSMTLTMKMEMDMGAAAGGMPEMKMPEMQIKGETTVRSVAPDGNITFDMVFTDAGVVGGEDSSNPMSKVLADGMASFKGTTAVGVVSDRGMTRSMDFKLSPDAPPTMRQSLEQSKDAFSQTALPEEAIGAGAKWEVKESSKAQGMTLDQTSTFEVVAINGDIISLRVTVKQRSPGQSSGMAKMESEGSGTVKMDLSKVMTTLTDMKMKTETTMNMNIGGEKQSMTMKMGMTIRLESK
jgi:hypothetical protein